MASGNDLAILERIESVQSSVTSVIGEVYTAAHMATLLIARGGAHTEADGLAPPVGFDLRQLVPEGFRPEDTFQWDIPVAPITLQDLIERNTNAGSPDERYKLLGQENLKFWHTRLLSPGAGSAATSSDMHPVWSLIFEDIRASG
ncbi:hypothetical protein BGZ72_003024, partial [Mortierella alpina]